MRTCLFEDRFTAELGPLTLTRPASDLLCGITSLGEKQTRYFAAEPGGSLCRPVLAGLLRSRRTAAPVNDFDWLGAAPTVLVNSRWLPPASPVPSLRPRLDEAPLLGLCDGEVAFAILEPHHLRAVSLDSLDDCLEDWREILPTCPAGGRLIRYPWELVDRNVEQIRLDFDAMLMPSAAVPPGLGLVGPADRLFLHPSASIDPMVVADTTKGPVWIGPDAVISAFTRLEGPCVIGAGTQILGAKIRAGTTLGPQCRIGGEVECSIVQGFTNKYHDGFLGHSYVGEWVNLAAGASTGDLRCDYRPISARMNGRIVSTGLTKVGSIIGDHARTGLGVLLNCGTVIGPFAGILPTGELAPREFPAFARYGPEGMSFPSDIEEVLATADMAMSRRGQSVTPELREVYLAIAKEMWGSEAESNLGLREPA
jgi:UDP-N-acetylglucosamine diphosphorylase/glucosamine-1-phosphate N-acetyltransferase